MKTHALFFLFLTIAWMSACGSATEGGASGEGDSSGDSSSLTATLSSIQENIFTPTCAVSGCHAGATASGGLSLAAGESYGELVGTNSSEVSGMKRVAAGDPDGSYLLYKLEGTQATAGGSGSTMPKGGDALADEQIDAIIAWIENGAAND